MKPTMNETVKAPEGVTFSAAGRVVTAKGPKGEASYNCISPLVTVKVEAGQVTFSAPNASKREKALIFSYAAHVRNMIRGVQKPYAYILKICSSHFPMNVAVAGKTMSVKNFLGEKVPRVATFPDGVTVKVEGDRIRVESSSKELAGRVAGRIELLTAVANRDRRIFQDGIYLIEKDGEAIA